MIRLFRCRVVSHIFCVTDDECAMCTDGTCYVLVCTDGTEASFCVE